MKVNFCSMLITPLLLFYGTMLHSNGLTSTSSSNSSSTASEVSNAALAASGTSAIETVSIAAFHEAVSTQIGSQMAESFGYCPTNTTYTLQVFNDAPVAINAHVHEIISVQGTQFNYQGAPAAAQNNIASYTAANPTTFNNIKICHGFLDLDMTTSGNFFKRAFDVEANDPNTYFYHAFQTSESIDSNGNNIPEGEFMGPGMYGGPYISSPEFDGVFFNKSPYQAQFSFKKNGQTYNVSLESLSFSLLSSDSWVTDSIRSASETRNFSFTIQGQQQQIPLNALGMGDTFYDPTSGTTQAIPLTYTYEIYQLQNQIKATIQGFNMGNYNQIGILDISPTTTPSTLAPLRDLNPVDCYVWIESTDQYQQSTQSSSSSDTNAPPSQISITQPGTFWASYQTMDQTITQQLTVGQWQSNSFSIIRPQNQETTGQLYIFNVNTADTAKATEFLKNVASTDLASSILSTSITSTQIPTTLATQLLPNSNGIITDKASGVTGTLLLVDTFIPYGGGTKMPRYYQIPPALLQINFFSGVVTSNLDSTTFASDSTQASAMMALEFSQKIQGWLTTFNQNMASLKGSQFTISNVNTNANQLESLVPDLTTYLKTKGIGALFTNPTASGDSRTFSQQGLTSLYLILFGPISLSNPPVIQQPGSNVYLGLQPGQLPQGWPSS